MTSLSHKVRVQFNLNGGTTLLFCVFNARAFLVSVMFVLVAHGDDAIVAGDGVTFAAVVRFNAEPGGSASEHFPVPPESPAIHHQHWVPKSRHTPLR